MTKHFDVGALREHVCKACKSQALICCWCHYIYQYGPTFAVLRDHQIPAPNLPSRPLIILSTTTELPPPTPHDISQKGCSCKNQNEGNSNTQNCTIVHFSTVALGYHIAKMTHRCKDCEGAARGEGVGLEAVSEQGEHGQLQYQKASQTEKRCVVSPSEGTTEDFQATLQTAIRLRLGEKKTVNEKECETARGKETTVA